MSIVTSVWFTLHLKAQISFMYALSMILFDLLLQVHIVRSFSVHVCLLLDTGTGGLVGHQTSVHAHIP